MLLSVSAQMKSFTNGTTSMSVPLDNPNRRLCLAKGFFGLRTHEEWICSTVASEVFGLPGDFPLKTLPVSFKHVSQLRIIVVLM